MHRIGIISRKAYKNFGNILQLTALSETLKDLGYDPVIANYTYHGWRRPAAPAGIFRSVCRKVFHKLPHETPEKTAPELYNLERREKFRRFFEKWTCLSPPANNASELFMLAETCDAFIAGSDQVWAPMWYDSHYFLDFLDEDAKKIAYAASFGRESIDSPVIAEKMRADISRFAHISVREESGRRIVRDLVHREAAWVLDPTLLLPAEHYHKFEDPTCVPDAPYLLCYFLGGRRENWQRSRAIAEALGLKMAVIPYLIPDLDEGDLRFPEAGPADFLALFHHAAYVCTDSFHGTVFSILYRRPFTVFERNAQASQRMTTRIESLLHLTGLSSRFSQNGSMTPERCRQSVDFDAAFRKIESARADSLSFLIHALEQACAAPRRAPFRITNICCGCGACVMACPRGAISIQRDGQGFRAAVIDRGKCVGCGLCRKVCPFVHVSGTMIEDMQGLYAFKADAQTLQRSSSGGFSFALGEYLAHEGFSMAGCVYCDEERRAVHRVAAPEDAETRRAFCGSKYVQSDLEPVYAAIRAGVDRCLFIGTPCQTAAVAHVLGGGRENWVLVDLICHGVPTDALLEKYLTDLERRLGRAPRITFRDKRHGWNPQWIAVEGSGQRYASPASRDPFMRFYLTKNALRESCHECPYRRRSLADIRIGDYWGSRCRADREGVSMVAALTARGLRLIESAAASAGARCESMPVSDYAEGQPAYENPKMSFERTEILADLNDPSISLSQAYRKWFARQDRVQQLRGLYGSLKKKVRR